MSEGRLHKCEVTEGPDGFTMFVKSRPHVRSQGKTWDGAFEGLIDAICEKLGDGEAQVTFGGLVPTAAADRPWVHPGYAHALANGDCFVRWNTDAQFPDGICGLCGKPHGERNRTPFVAWRGGDGDYCSPWYESERRMTMWMRIGFWPLFFSEPLFDLLNDRERAEFDWLPVQMPPRCRKKYVECIPRKVIPLVAHRQWECDWLRCDECGRGNPRCSPLGNMADFHTMRIDDWIAASSVPRQPSLPFAIGIPAKYYLVFPITRAQELSRSKPSRGLALFHLGVIPDDEVHPSPPFRSQAKLWGKLRADDPDSEPPLR
jgi:hypothetical protein